MSNAALIASDISKRFGTKRVLDGADLMLSPGEVVAV